MLIKHRTIYTLCSRNSHKTAKMFSSFSNIFWTTLFKKLHTKIILINVKVEDESNCNIFYEIYSKIRTLNFLFLPKHCEKTEDSFLSEDIQPWHSQYSQPLLLLGEGFAGLYLYRRELHPLHPLQSYTHHQGRKKVYKNDQRLITKQSALKFWYLAQGFVRFSKYLNFEESFYPFWHFSF